MGTLSSPIFWGKECEPVTWKKVMSIMFFVSCLFSSSSLSSEAWTFYPAPSKLLPRKTCLSQEAMTNSHGSLEAIFPVVVPAILVQDPDQTSWCSESEVG